MEKIMKDAPKKQLGMKALIGKEVTFFGMNYIYHGTLLDCDDNDVLIKDASIVYETGDFEDQGFKNIQYVCKEMRLKQNTIESYAVLDVKNK